MTSTYSSFVEILVEVAGLWVGVSPRISLLVFSLISIDHLTLARAGRPTRDNFP